ncbi:hypothetical protein DCAR_0206489 [Daucus carota subsp. sativus]|uniref:UspA domain-containing protein n=1 Tax=Daucus carota subsp. sativus TaxID=79200 RepID=A0AAF0WEF5_DAUCS|nr:hypothetical protein DCAR_0206489 [Daucus carota subsp. sativus]
MQKVLKIMVTEKMMNEQRILVAADESEESMLALSWCLTNLFLEETLILLWPDLSLHFIVRVPVFWRCGSHGKYGKDLAMSVMRRAQSICSKFNSNIKVETKAGSGDAKEVICATVKKLEADMLVIGSHNYGFLKRTLVGSVSNYCSKHVKCPTVVVKQPKNEKLVEI